MARGRLLLLCLTMGLGITDAATAAGGPKPRTSFYGVLEDADVSRAWSSLQTTLETRLTEESGAWRNDSTGSAGSVTPLRTYRITAGTYCRDYRETIARNGRAIARIGTACRDENGAWLPVER